MIFYGGGKKPHVLHHQVVVVLLVGLSVFFAQCFGPSEPKKARAVKARIKRELGGLELGNIRDKRHSVGNPSKQRAEASGIGCGSSRGDAIKSASRVALFNLRKVTGNARYQVDLKVLNEKAGTKEYCLEMLAKARP